MFQQRKGEQSMLNIDSRAYLTTAEAADQIGYNVRVFYNLRSRHGDKFLRAYELMPGRFFYQLEDVQRVARERAR